MDVQVKERTPGSRNILFRPFVSAVTAFPGFLESDLYRCLHAVSNRRPCSTIALERW